MNKALYCNGLLLILACVPLKAQEKVEKLPSIAFLEYLAELQEVDGKLYGPQDMKIKSCQLSTQEKKEQYHETSNDINVGQNDNAKKRQVSTNVQECKHHD
jgi:hypothetical protein